VGPVSPGPGAGFHLPVRVLVLVGALFLVRPVVGVALGAGQASWAMGCARAVMPVSMLHRYVLTISRARGLVT
jgi:hypothetical protein